MGLTEMEQDPKGWARTIQLLSPRGLWLVGVIAAAAAVSVASAAAVAMLRHSPYWLGWSPVLMAIVVVVVVPMVGLLPLGLCNATDFKRISKAAYTGTPIRMGTAMVLGLLILLNVPDRPSRLAFGIWLGGLYLVSLVMETAVLAVWLRGQGGGTRV
jgi:hypothetical protein